MWDQKEIYIVYSYLVRLILKESKKKRGIACLSLSAKRPYNVRRPDITHIKRWPSDSQEPPWHVIMTWHQLVKTAFISNNLI